MQTSDSSNKGKRIYLPFGTQNRGHSPWPEMVREIMDSWELTWRFFQRDFAVNYRQSILGYFWAVIPPLASAGTFVWLNHTKVLSMQVTDLPYPVFVLLNMAVWEVFASGLLAITQSLVNAGNLITKISFPRETLVLAAFGRSIFEFWLRLLLVLVAFLVTGTSPHWSILLVPVCLVPLCLFTLGVGFVCALLNGIVRDTGRGMVFVLTVWMFLTPVVYPIPRGGLPLIAYVVNPVTGFVVAAQDIASKGYLSQPVGFLLSCTIGIVVFLTGWRVFHLLERRIAERV